MSQSAGNISEQLDRGLREPLKQHEWAALLAFQHFARGLTHLVESQASSDRYLRFLLESDSVYRAIMDGLDDHALASTFVSYWKIAHTMATQSRFWMEDTIAEIVASDPRWEGRRRQVYTGPMLAAGMYGGGISLSDLGEEQREELLSLRQPWKVSVQRSALEEIDRLVGLQERSRPTIPIEGRDDAEMIAYDMEQLAQVEQTLRGPPPEEVSLHCNLLIVEPPKADGKPHIWAFRFVNPRTMSAHATRKQERVNLLRLHAFLLQEKILRDPRYLRVAVAEILPRHGQLSGATYFSSRTYWHADQFWDFLGVPYEAVEVGIRTAGRLLGEHLRGALRHLLPAGRGDQRRPLDRDLEG